MMVGLRTDQIEVYDNAVRRWANAARAHLAGRAGAAQASLTKYGQCMKLHALSPWAA